MLVQIAFSALWMAGNFNTVPGFGDCAEYLELSRTLALDEYRPVLYPLLLRLARAISEADYYKYMYVLQTGLSLFCMGYAVFAIDTLRYRHWKPRDLALWAFGGLYLNAIPMITFMNFSVLTDSLANSMLVLFLAISIQVIYAGRVSVGRGRSAGAVPDRAVPAAG